MHQHTLISRFWNLVFTNPGADAVIVKNPFTDVPPEVILGTARPGMMPQIIYPPQLTSVTWRGAGEAVATIMAFLRQNGFQHGDRAAILGWNSAEWVWADLAIQSLGGVTVPIYPHSTAEQVNFVLENCGAKFTFSNEKEQLEKVTRGKTVHFDEIPPAVWNGLPKRPFINWHVRTASPELVDHADNWPAVRAELAVLSRGYNKRNFCGVLRGDLATIIYTSGSTGVPKGVCLTHGNIAAACEAMNAHGFKQDPERDLYVSFLPLAHVYERVPGMAMAIWNGCTVVFCKVDEVGEALKTHSPTIMLGVPAVWRKIKERIESKFAQAQGMKKKLIHWAFEQEKSGFKHWLADKLVFSRVREELGGKLRVMLSGGAPISPDVIEFFNGLGLELLQGYGLTETTGAVTANRPHYLSGQKGPLNKVGSVGQALPGTKIRIVAEPGDSSGQGEIQINGDLVFKGYWNLPEENAKTFTADGWFKTGDLGRLDEDGFLFITGRKKRLLKTEGGKYVAPEKIEKALEPHPIVQYIVAVGDGRKYISGLVFINQTVATQLLGRAIPAGVDAAAYIATQPEIIKAVDEAVAATNSKLERWETLKKVKIIPVEALVLNGLLTPTLKIRSEEAAKRYKEEVEALYS